MARRKIPVRTNVSPEQFVKIWQRETALSDVIQSLNTRKNTASVRASYYRKKGVPLQYFGNVPILDDRTKDLIAIARTYHSN